ncbi:peptidyl-prolyl cis-trans isomerase C [Cribrihabitans marinus]|uniref:Parvulin-like PPIase n=1 Tax=Cribrihabitans marinus TaxID=1227549 RepID=A0A1H6YLG5_9RHOB|nr:peptidylprolyl isomerase [Cribrihabitans marinus]GGH28777.1 peptidylprolyl isomerase [Cribrihabitans marinus]SEJ37565.1 peptidyl-prolyl cis-trans isomerase C [Cribrihabitans marinus]
MPKGLTFLASATLALTLAMPLAAEEAPGADTVVARVNGEEITLGHMIVARAGLPQQYQQLPDEVLYEAIMDQLIQQNLMQQAQGGEVPKRIELQLENERRSLMAAELIEGVMQTATTEDAIQKAYDAAYADGFGGEEYNASHILVESEDEAKAIRADLEGGADFAATAKEKSTGPSGPNGGELGWFSEGSMVPPFEEAVMSLEKGQISDPVQTQFGWHVIVLNDKRMAEAPELDEVRDELAQQVQRAAVDAKVAELTKGAEIERPEIEDLDPSILSDLSLIEE